MTQQSVPSPLASILADIRRAIEATLYYPALVVALTIPEICVTLCWDRDMTVKEKHYAAFINKYTSPSELGLDGLSCYRLRCGVIHRGNAVGHPRFAGTHVIFTTPDTGMSIHAMSIQYSEKISAMFDLVSFCEAMTQAALRWYAEYQQHPKVIENMPRLLSWRPLGVPPFFAGAPVIASEA